MDGEVYKIALSLIPNVGALLARRLVAYTGSAEAVFNEKKNALEKIPGIGNELSGSVQRKQILKLAEDQLTQIDKLNLKFFYYLDKNYPARLKQCEDAPVIFYTKGKFNANPAYSVAIVGTRKPSDLGKELCSNLVQELSHKNNDIQIVSGLAYGIDITAHKTAMGNKMDTVAVLGHGLHMIYPASHSKYACDIEKNGALLTEFPTTKKPDPGNFVSRNRIIAGLSDVTVVVESAVKGGALLTADMAFSYNREVVAYPGRVNDKYSQGCNALIKQNKAALIENADDLMAVMRWEPKGKEKVVQAQLFYDLEKNEQLIVDALKQAEQISIDELGLLVKQPLHVLKSDLLNLEFKGLVKAMPGNAFKLIGSSYA